MQRHLRSLHLNTTVTLIHAGVRWSQLRMPSGAVASIIPISAIMRSQSLLNQKFQRTRRPNSAKRLRVPIVFGI